MINLPLLNSLDVVNYGLYPGDDLDNPGLHQAMGPGLTLVLGANGLGKTTLVMMLYRLLTGPYDISALARPTELGNADTSATELSSSLRRIFARRVSDNATNAVATLAFHIGGEEVLVSRSLRNLALLEFAVGETTFSAEEATYQEEIKKLAGVSTFGDWILLLRYVVFYFEDRRSLVWDPSAQRQLLRILFLDPDESEWWLGRERDILVTDSKMRNTRAVFTREAGNLAVDESRSVSEPEIRQRILQLEQELQRDHSALENLHADLADLQDRHEGARLRFHALAAERESRFRNLERQLLLMVHERLPKHSDYARFILGQLLSDTECLVCGNSVPSVAESMEARIRGNLCLVCGSGLISSDEQTEILPSSEEISTLEEQLRNTSTELETASISLAEAEGDRKSAGDEIGKLRASIANCSASLESLLRRLPPGEGDLHERRQELSSLRGRLELEQRDLDEKRQLFQRVVSDANSVVEKQATEIQNYFADYARDFLVEECRLVWSPSPGQLGQGGISYEFPAFGLELGGSDFSGTVRRTGPDNVSESQREFIDISFRMALAKVATPQGTTSLVMDAPESSLDSVFTKRAARVLGRFGRREEGNRLVITSNLVEGDLIPSLLMEASSEGDPTEQVMDLLKVAAPTAAIRDLRSLYSEARDRILDRARAATRGAEGFRT